MDKAVMSSEEAFRQFGHAIETDPIGVLLARWRRDTFATALRRLPGVVEVIPSGSLARGTQVGPIHDIDLIVVFGKSAYPDWGSENPASARAALVTLEEGIRRELGGVTGPVGGTELRNHVVKCSDVWLGPLDGIIPSGPPVDVMPAIRAGSHLRVPEQRNGRWVDVDPEKLIRLVVERKREWEYFDEVVRMVKDWAEHQHLRMSSLAVEVLVLKYLPRPRFFETMSCGEAVARFFEAAARAHITSLTNPAGRYGEIDPGMDYAALRRALSRGAGLARKAMDAEHALSSPGSVQGLIQDPGVFWRLLFGKRYPRARKPFLLPYSDAWFLVDRPDPATPRAAHQPDPSGPGRPGPDDPPDGPSRPPGPRPGPAGAPPSGPDPGPAGPPPSGPDRGPAGPPPPSPGGGGGAGPRPDPDPAPEPAADPWAPLLGQQPSPVPRTPATSGGDSGPGLGSASPRAQGLMRRRYLRGQCPASAPVGKPFSLLVSIVLEADLGSAALELFEVPPEGQDVLLVVHAPGLRLLGDQRQTVHVPADRNSAPVMFELRADAPGPRRISVTAWIGGSYLGELLVEVTAERDAAPGPHREIRVEIDTEPDEGAVSLVVRYDRIQNAYRFEFRDEDNPDEVTSNLAYDPRPLVEQLVAGLDEIAKGRSGYSGTEAQIYLKEAGAGLWTQLIPAQLREQFWERRQRIRQLTILADSDAVPWELLYPMDPGHDGAGFLVEQFPVTRAIFRWLPGRTLNLSPARFVLPEDPLPEARAEIEAMRRLLAPGQPAGEVISRLTPLQDLIANGSFGLLHFACHNTYNPADGSSITLNHAQFTPTLMTTAAINKVLAHCAPTVFINACRSAGLHATYNQLDGWARKFLEAGAAAFIGSLWAVSDGAAREFAQEFYGLLQSGSSLGDAAWQVRRRVAGKTDDPTWLAYTVYGNPRAAVHQQ